MKKLIVIFGIILAIPVLWITLAIISETWNTWTYRYRLTLQVSVDGTVRSSSGVLQVQATEGTKLIPHAGSVSKSVFGQAVIVDLGKQGLMFALMRDVSRPFSIGMWLAGPENIVQSAFTQAEVEGERQGFVSLMRRYLRSGEKLDLKPNQLPLLVRFRNIADPSTVERVDPNNLAASFGPGVQLIGATIEIVPPGLYLANLLGLSGPEWLAGVPVTTGIRQTLPWLSLYPGRSLGGPGVDGLPRSLALHHGDFVQGVGP